MSLCPTRIRKLRRDFWHRKVTATGFAYKLRKFASGGNGHGPLEQTEEVNIPNLYSFFTFPALSYCFAYFVYMYFVYMYFYISTARRPLYDYAGLGRAFICIVKRE